MKNQHVEEEHGGHIVQASAQYGIDSDQWIDLSTGINPKAYPVELESKSFQQLPYLRPEFIAASTAYYRSPHFIPVAGTQAAIQQLPKLLAHFPVLLPQVGYQEHAKYWQLHNTPITYYPSLDKTLSTHFIHTAIAENPEQHVVIINPNNPSGLLFEKQQLLSWAKLLAPQAYLIVDEAFIDTDNDNSVLDNALPHNVIVLRSFGKFFGLAGIRLGYCFANQFLLDSLKKRLGLWQVNGPAQAIAIHALQDTYWQETNKKEIRLNAEVTREITEPLITASHIDSASCFYSCLFSSYKMPLQQALLIKHQCAQLGVLVRVIQLHPELDGQQALLRIGLLDRDDASSVKRVQTAFAMSTKTLSQQCL